MKTRMRNVMLGAMLVVLLTTGIGYADLADGLVGYWSFDNDVDPGHDDSGNGHHGTVVGAISTPGMVDNALSFDGIDDYVQVAQNAETILASGHACTVALWMNMGSLPAISQRTVGCERVNDGFAVDLNGAGLEIFASTGIEPHYSTPITIQVGVWYHVAMTFQEDHTWDLFVDGELRATLIQDWNYFTGDRPLIIGADSGDYRTPTEISTFAHATIDEVRIYSRALEPGEIQQLAGTAEPTPAEQIQEILDFVDESVGDGTLVGVGPGKSAENKLNTLINQLEQVQDFIGDELFVEACLQLQDAYKKCDGQSHPDDTVTGNAVPELAEKIDKLMESLSCPPAPDLGFGDDFVDPWPDIYSQNWIWKKSGPWENIFENTYSTYLSPEHVSVSDSKLVLIVPANQKEGAEIRSITEDFHYGWYEARIKVSAEPGVVNAFFMRSPVGNNNEIDIEFLSNECGTDTGKVHFVLHPFYEGQPHDSEIDLCFDPSEDFNYYAFAWSAYSVDFFVNGEPKASMPVSLGFPVPSRPGQLLLSNWSAGIPDWGGDPPDSPAVMEVEWVSFTPQGD